MIFIWLGIEHKYINYLCSIFFKNCYYAILLVSNINFPIAKQYDNLSDENYISQNYTNEFVKSSEFCSVHTILNLGERTGEFEIFME